MRRRSSVFFAPKPKEVVEGVVGMIERSDSDRKVVDELKTALAQGKRGRMEVARNGAQVAMKSLRAVAIIFLEQTKELQK